MLKELPLPNTEIALQGELCLQPGEIAQNPLYIRNFRLFGEKNGPLNLQIRHMPFADSLYSH